MTAAPAAGYSQADLERAIRGCGVQEGDIVFTHVGMGMLGFPETGKTEGAMFDAILGAYRRVLGDGGTLLVPTYSYSFCRGESFDPDTTPSTVGSFTELFRRVPGVKRSREPIFSVAGFGPAVDALFKDLPRECFGPDCIYDRLVQVDAKLCNVGVGFRYATFIHYVEQSCAVPYRFLKMFSGDMVDGERRERQSWLYNVAVLEPECYPDLTRLERAAFERGAARKAPVGRGQVTCIGLRALDALSREGIASDHWYLAKGPARDMEGPQASRAGEVKPDLRTAAPAESLKGAVERLWTADAYPVTAACDAVLEDLGRGLGLETLAVESGKRVGGRIVPERWTCRSATLSVPGGGVVLSRKESRLLVPYFSHPFQGEVSHSELERRTYVRAHAAPAVSHLHQQRWGLAMSRERFASLTADRYRIEIDTAFSWGRMRIAHGSLRPPDHRSEILLLAHHDHSGLANEGLSGAVVAAEVFRRLRAADSDAPVRLVLAPRDLGLVALLQERPEIRARVACVLRLEALGHDENLSLHGLSPLKGGAARLGDALRAAGAAWAGAQEDAVAGLDAPILSLSRAAQPATATQFETLRSEADVPALVDERRLVESADVLFGVLRRFSIE